MSDREIGWMGAQALRPCEHSRGFCACIYPHPDGDLYGYEDPYTASGCTCCLAALGGSC